MSTKSVQQECQARVSRKSVKKDCQARVSSKSVKPECVGKSVQQECQARESFQEWLARRCASHLHKEKTSILISALVFVHSDLHKMTAFGFVGSISFFFGGGEDGGPGRGRVVVVLLCLVLFLRRSLIGVRPVVRPWILGV